MFSTVPLVLFVTFVVELFLMVQVSGLIGSLSTALLVVVLSMSGIAFLRARGGGLVRATLTRLSEKGSVDTHDLADRLLIIIAGLLLVVPGFLTAGMALLLLLPPVRALVRPALLARLATSTGLNLRFGRSFVDVDEVVDDDKRSDPPTSTRPELG